MIKILKIEFNNFRQYKHVTINFDQNCKNHLHILKATNGTGKTNFLNAVLWCLYADEKYLSDTSRALPIINESVVENSKAGDKLFVNVRMTICDEKNNIEFSRTQDFTVIEDPFKKNKNVIPGLCTFKIIITNLNDPNKNTVVYDDESYTLSIVKQYFDVEIFDYYFFNGENLENYFSTDANKTGKIKKSIYNLAQVTLLETAIDRVSKMAVEKSRKSNQGSSWEGFGYYRDLEQCKNDIINLTAANTQYEEENNENIKRLSEINETLNNIKPIKLQQESREKLVKRLKELEEQKESEIIKRNNFIIDYTIYLNYYPLIKSTLNTIYEKEKSGSLPPDIDKKLLQKILDDKITACPVCSNTIDQNSVLAIKKMISNLDVDSKTSHKLMEIKAPLEDFVNKAENYPKERRALVASYDFLNSQIDECKEELDNISAFLSKVGTIDDINIPDLEAERNDLDQELTANKNSIAHNIAQIKIREDKIKKLEKLIEEYEKKKKYKDDLVDQVRIFRQLASAFEIVKTSIAEEIKLEIEEVAWDFFDSMIWKTQTFGRLEINDDYIVSVYNINGKETIGSMSATELMALAYSFTFAIHKASGKNCPLIIDSPLGRVSDDNRINMANELLKVSKHKQIIMLFTPDEYSEDVRNLYDKEAGSVRDIKLSEDESEILEVGV